MYSKGRFTLHLTYFIGNILLFISDVVPFKIRKTLKPFYNKVLGVFSLPLRRRLPVFYSSFIRKGDLVFDIGANVGDLTYVFMKFGARVVCVEPQPLCFKILGERFGNTKSVMLENCGIADKSGAMLMHINSTSPLISTFSSGFMQRPSYKNQVWDSTIKVPVLTLDALIKKYGIPDFCKIDVEGFEYPVLKGLNRPIKYLSFEFSIYDLSSIKQCVDHLLSLGPASFNYSLGNDYVLHFDGWVSSDTLMCDIKHLPKNASGDIYVTYQR